MAKWVGQVTLHNGRWTRTETVRVEGSSPHVAAARAVELAEVAYRKLYARVRVEMMTVQLQYVCGSGNKQVGLGGPMSEPIKLLHVYAQEVEHEEVWIVGSWYGLVALRDALNDAIRTEEQFGHAEFLAADGEGYAVRVVQEDTPWQGNAWRRLLLPYTAESARDVRRPGTLMPWEVGKRAAPLQT